MCKHGKFEEVVQYTNLYNTFNSCENVFDIVPLGDTDELWFNNAPIYTKKN